MSLSTRQAADLIRAGQLVAFPTETVYGLGANALDAAAVRRIFALKGRPESSPLIVHVASMEMARSCVAAWPPQAEGVARRYWPGPLTLVLPKAPEIPDVVTAGLATVGIRMPAHPIALELIREAGLPIAAPSANRFAGLSPTTAEHVRRAFGESVPVLDGGPTGVGIESTVISLAGDKLVLLRPGMISFGGIEAASPPRHGSHASPGMHERHYSPRTRLLLVEDGALPEGCGAYVWWKREAPAARTVRMPADEAGYAARLYAVLHELDPEGLEWIAVETPPAEWTAIRDRLRRASGTDFSP